jgi:hypothetical protein
MTREKTNPRPSARPGVPSITSAGAERDPYIAPTGDVPSEFQFARTATGRSCGSCSLCCKLYPIGAEVDAAIDEFIESRGAP